MEATITKLPEEEAVSRLLYHLVLSRILRDKEAPCPKEESPAKVFQINLPLTTGNWPIIIESYLDGSWAVCFKDSPDIIAGSNVSLEDALDGLSDIIYNDLHGDENISAYQKKTASIFVKGFWTMTLREHRRKVLQKLGFLKREGRKHEVWTLKDRGGKVQLNTTVSRNNGDIGNGLLAAICVQLHITKTQYREIVSCNMSKTDYYNHLLDKEIVP